MKGPPGGSVALWLALEARRTVRALSLPADELRELARRRLRDVLRWAGRTPFHQRRLAEAGVASHRALIGHDPEGISRALRPVSKAELRAAGGDTLVGGVVLHGWRSSTSSGSTGEPFRIFYDPRAWAMLKFLVKLRARAAAGVGPRDRLALFDAFPPEHEGRSLLERAGRVCRISVLQPAHAMAARLAAFRPDAIYGLPSALQEVAGALWHAGERLRVRSLFTSGELLHPPSRRSLADAYGARVYDVYGTSETKEIAWECPDGGLHVNADVVRVEILDPHGRALPPGDEGEIVVTLLVNHAMPLVRYQTGDRGSLRPALCRCGLALPLLGVVTGREADVLELAGGRRVSPYALTCALEEVATLQRYQVSQVAPSRLRVRALYGAAADRDGLAAEIRAALHRRVSPTLGVDVEFVDRFPDGARGKFRIVEPLSASTPTPSSMRIEEVP